MDEYLVISWWNYRKEHDIVPETTTHHNLEMAMEESKKRKKVLGKNAKVTLTKIIKEF